MTAPVGHSHDTDLVEVLAQHVVMDDGVMGTRLQAAELNPDEIDDREAGADAKYVRLQSG